jgi:hypothetical protein
MKRTLAMPKGLAFCTALAVAVSCGAANAQQLAKSGSISFHTGWKDTGEALTVADKHMQGHGSVVGVTFNDKGSGPLHFGPAECFYTFFVVDGRGKNKGFCAFGDADGDRIFTDWHGTVNSDHEESTNEIVGGTGKYAGIQGSGPWQCKGAGQNSETLCTQRLDYRLP